MSLLLGGGGLMRKIKILQQDFTLKMQGGGGGGIFTGHYGIGFVLAKLSPSESFLGKGGGTKNKAATYNDGSHGKEMYLEEIVQFQQYF